MLKTRKANPNNPPRILIMGVEGVGKSTFGAKADKPIFISPEGGSDRLRKEDGSPVDEIIGITSWEAIITAVKDLTNESHDFKTVVLDSADWIEQLAHERVIATSRNAGNIITCHGGYGAGYRESELIHKYLIGLLSVLREKRDMNIIVTAHAHVKQVKDPDVFDDYDCFEVKCHEKVSSLWREWVDALFFVRFKTFSKSGDGGKARAFADGSRVVYTQKKPAFQAKNRYGMPGEMEFTESFWKEFQKYSKAPEMLGNVQFEIQNLMFKIRDEEKLKAIHSAIKDAGLDVQKLASVRDRLVATTGEEK